MAAPHERAEHDDLEDDAEDDDAEGEPKPATVEAKVAVFQAYLRRQGLKLTTQRNSIARKIFSTHRHFSAEELLELLRGERRDISKATVYRTLALLERAHLLSSIDFQRGFKFYEHTDLVGHEHHEHIMCVECHKIVEFRDADLETFHERIASRLGFEVITHTYKIFGLCEDCRRRGSGAKLDAEKASITR